MGSTSSDIEVAVIDLRNKEEDFRELKGHGFKCHYYSVYQDFLSNQSLKDLSYIVIRQQIEAPSSKKDILVEQKIRESKLAEKSYDNKKALQDQFNEKVTKRQPLLREILINYVRKYELERLLIYVLVEDSLNFKLPEYEEPYITLIADNVKTIKTHLQRRPEGAEPTLFKFRSMVKDLFRRTVVKILDSEENKKERDLRRSQWQKFLDQKITFGYDKFDEDDFKQGLISNYYDYIVLSSSQVLTAVQDMKKEHKFQSKIIYFGNLQHYGHEQYGQQTEQKLQEVKTQLWMYSDSMTQIAEAIKNCTDIKGDITEVVPTNIVIYTHFHYGKQLQDLFKLELLNLLKRGFTSDKKKKTKSANINEPNWQKNLNISIVSEMGQLKNAFKRQTFSYLITFDCTVHQIEEVKAYLRLEKYDKRVYMYNADEEESVSARVDILIKDNHPQKVKEYLMKRVQTVAEKAGFLIKFQMGPIDEITTYKISEKESAHFCNKLGLLTFRIGSRQELLDCYTGSNREKIINGFCLVLRTEDYFNDWKEFLEKDLQKDPKSYLGRVKVIIFDEKKNIRSKWGQIENDMDQERIVFVHYNLNKINEFLQILQTPRINLTIFIKKSLPNFFKAYRKLDECKFNKIELTVSIVSKGSLLKEVFEDKNFKLSKHHKLNLLNLRSTNFNLQKSLSFLHEEFLLRYALLWITGYQIIQKNEQLKINIIKNLVEEIKSCLFKCKSYYLLDVSEEEFEYFYIKRLDQCKTYLDLQITVMYIISLPHGLFYVLKLIFEDPLSTCLTPKAFSVIVVILLTCFCSFQDEVINKKRFVVFLNDLQTENFSEIMQYLKIGDVMFNKCFTFVGNDEGSQENLDNHCLFIEFDNIPMLSETHIKNYLHLEPFSFYKESTEYLIAPYTEFTVKNKERTPKGKIHLTLRATSNSKKGFVSKVFSSNQINEEDLFNVVLEEATKIKSSNSNEESQRIKEVKSLYKKAELIGIFEEKMELVKSIIEGSDYKKFIQAMSKKKYMQAVGHLKSKEHSQKSTLEIQATHFKKMLGVQKALLYYTLGEYDPSINQLDRVIKYLLDQSLSDEEDWVVRQVKNYKKSVDELNIKRQKYLNKMEKIKKWKVTADIGDSQNCNIEVTMESKGMTWDVGYNPWVEQFYIRKQKEHQDEETEELYAYSGIPAFGELAPDFPKNSSYETLSQRNKIKKTQSLSEIKLAKIKQLVERQNKDSVMSPIRGRHQQGSPDKIRESEKEENEKQILMLTSCLKSRPETPKVQKQEPFCYDLFESHLFQKKQTQVEDHIDFLLGVEKEVQWQCFFYEDEFVLTQKGKHYKTKVVNKHNL